MDLNTINTILIASHAGLTIIIELAKMILGRVKRSRCCHGIEFETYDAKASTPSVTTAPSELYGVGEHIPTNDAIDAARSAKRRSRQTEDTVGSTQPPDKQQHATTDTE